MFGGCGARYEERGIFGQVVDADLSDSGVCELKVQEAVVSKVRATNPLNPQQT